MTINLIAALIAMIVSLICAINDLYNSREIGGTAIYGAIISALNVLAYFLHKL